MMGLRLAEKVGQGNGYLVWIIHPAPRDGEGTEKRVPIPLGGEAGVGEEEGPAVGRGAHEPPYPLAQAEHRSGKEQLLKRASPSGEDPF
jgi:hypothetical protein